jgi:hypothetical protein
MAAVEEVAVEAVGANGEHARNVRDQNQIEG